MKAQIVSFHCVLKNRLGQVLSSSFNQDVINQLEDGNPAEESRKLRGLVAGIQNVRKGEKRKFTVSANDAYGPYNPDLVVTVSRSELWMGDRLVIGSEVVSQVEPNGSHQVYHVVQADGETLMLDGNHPLAGQDLVFEIEVVSARDARSDDFEEPFFAATSRYIH